MLKRIINKIKYVSKFTIFANFAYDLRRFIKFSGSEKGGLRAALIMAYHGIEKGLTMPNRRLGFGQQALSDMIILVEKWKLSESTEDEVYVHAISVLQEYWQLHADANYKLENQLADRLRKLLQEEEIVVDHQLEVTKENLFGKTMEPFLEFSQSRHSVRHFSGAVSEEQIRLAVALAQNAPSACNRQHVRVHCLVNKEQIQQLLALQNGNRGSGHLVDKLLLITYDMQDLRWREERNDGYTNAGIFVMNLCYALHYYHVAHCLLNWSVSPKNDEKMRALVAIPETETLVIIVACGDCPDNIRLAKSPRKRLSSIYCVHS